MRHVRLSVVAACVAVLLALVSPPLLTARQSPALTAQDLAALTFRTIGPANMSGRFVDMAVVESDPYMFYVASADSPYYVGVRLTEYALSDAGADHQAPERLVTSFSVLRTFSTAWDGGDPFGRGSPVENTYEWNIENFKRLAPYAHPNWRP